MQQRAGEPCGGGVMGQRSQPLFGFVQAARDDPQDLDGDPRFIADQAENDISRQAPSATIGYGLGARRIGFVIERREGSENLAWVDGFEGGDPAVG